MTVLTVHTNLLLSNLPSKTRASLLEHATTLELPIGMVLYEAERVPRYAYFPLSGLASVLTVMPTGESAEVGFIGSEGVVGSLHLLGPASLSTRCIMHLSGSVLRVPFTELQRAFDNSPEARGRILEFVQEQSAILAQIAACNSVHDAEQRLIRCLLMAQDQTRYETLNFTQEYLSQMISTRRTTVAVIAGDLQRRGFIRYRRGKIRIVDRRGLEAAACVCNPVINGLFSGLYKRVRS